MFNFHLILKVLLEKIMYVLFMTFEWRVTGDWLHVGQFIQHLQQLPPLVKIPTTAKSCYVICVCDVRE